AHQVLSLMRGEIERFVQKGIKPAELAMYKTQVKGQILLGAEDMENRMNSLGVNEMVFGEYRPIDEIIRDIDKVSVRSVRDYVAKYIDTNDVSLMVMGELAASEALKLMNVWE
ncbi:MAG TPA: insulinase family protein, partial [Bdellovibrionales bacterium]|nr:insulinase family protein [Bdellovibrionales bacterium]